MRQSGWFPVTVVAFVLAGTSPALAQDIPDDATRAHVAEWLDQCSRSASDACMPVIKRIEDSPMFGRCQAIEWQWDAARLVRDPENALHSFEEALGWREKALEFIAKCVPIYAAALDETEERDGSSRKAGDRWQVTPVDRVMQAVKRSNLRSGPGTTYGKVGLLDIGDEVRVTGVVGDWLRIAAPDGGEAFIYGPLLAEVTPDQGTAAAGQEQEPGPDTPADDGSRDAAYRGPVEPADRVMQAVKRSNLRSGPGLTHDLVGLLDIGDQVRVTGRVGDWLRIEPRGGGEAFIYGPLLLAEVTPDQGTTAVEREPEPASGTVALTEAVGTLDIPDKATRIRVADWWDRCTFSSVVNFDETCHLFQAVLRELGLPCRVLTGKVARTVTTPPVDAIREAERYLAPSARIDEDGRSNLLAYLRTCVTAYATALDSGSVASLARSSPGSAQGIRHDALASPAQDSVQRDGTFPDGPLHGSIAFSQDDDGAYAWGIAWSFDSSAGAQAEALGQCREYGGTRCAEAGWFQEACGALAVGGGNGYGTGWGATTAEAERDALAQCRVVNDDCRVEVARCSQSEQAGGDAGFRPTEGMDTAVGNEPDTSKPTEPEEEVCRWFAYVWLHVTEGPEAGSYAWTGADTTEAGAIDDAMSVCSNLRSGSSCAFAASCLVCQPADPPKLWDPPCDPDPDR